VIDKEPLISSLHELGAVKIGESGTQELGRSPLTLDMQLMASRPATLRRVVRMMATMAAKVKFDRIAAIPMGGLAVGIALGLTIDKPVVYQRLLGRESTVGRYLAGLYKAGESVLVVDDLLTGGDSQLEALAVLEMVRLKATNVMVVLDSGLGGRQILEAKNYKVHAVLTIPEILDGLLRLRRINPEQHRLVLEWLKAHEPHSTVG